MNVFLYDGSFEGLLTSIYHSFYSPIPPDSIYEKNTFQADMLTIPTIIETDIDKMNKVKTAIIHKIDSITVRNVYLIYLSNENEKGIIMYSYLKEAFKLGSDIHNFLHLDIVKKVNLLCRRVKLEAHRFKGFVRFSYINNQFLYSTINPDNNILELICPHFMNRFSNENWIIHDVNRNIAGVYNQHSLEIFYVEPEEFNNIKNLKDEYSILWKEYFNSTNIKERENIRLQKRMMPKRYWAHIPETQ